MDGTLRRNWPEYLMEAAELGLFMISAVVFTILLEHPASPAREAIPQAGLRRVLMGLAMGATAIAIIYSPWGRRSGAHFNPSVTFTFYRLGKIRRGDALWYVGAQFAGGAVAMLLAALALGSLPAHPDVRYAVTVPGPAGAGWAFAAEAAISFLLMLTVLFVSNHSRLARATGAVAGALVALYITIEAPISGMSMNPARTLASALPANLYTAAWIYLIAPTLGMLMAAQTYLALRGARSVACAKLNHAGRARCVFRCGEKTR